MIAVLYDLTLHMGYTYDTPASGARHIIRLMPLSLADRQRLVAGSITISPSPDEQSHFTDFFLHPATSILLRVAARDVGYPHAGPRAGRIASSIAADFSPDLDRLPKEVTGVWSLEPDSPHHFLASSPRLTETRAISDYARDCVLPGLDRAADRHCLVHPHQQGFHLRYRRRRR